MNNFKPALAILEVQMMGLAAPWMRKALLDCLHIVCAHAPSDYWLSNRQDHAHAKYVNAPSAIPDPALAGN